MIRYDAMNKRNYKFSEFQRVVHEFEQILSSRSQISNLDIATCNVSIHTNICSFRLVSKNKNSIAFFNEL